MANHIITISYTASGGIVLDPSTKVMVNDSDTVTWIPGAGVSSVDSISEEANSNNIFSSTTPAGALVGDVKSNAAAGTLENYTVTITPSKVVSADPQIQVRQPSGEVNE